MVAEGWNRVFPECFDFIQFISFWHSNFLVAKWEVLFSNVMTRTYYGFSASKNGFEYLSKGIDAPPGFDS